MKLSLCFATSILGLMLTKASMAADDPPGSQPAVVAPEEVQVPSSEQDTAREPQAIEPLAPAAVPEPMPTPPAPPSLAIGLGAPVADRVSASTEATSASPKARPFAGSQIFAQTSMSTATVFKGQQQSSNPTIDTALFLQPRYALSEAFQLRGRLVFNYELTNSDTTTTRNEPRFSDTALQLFYRKIPEILGGIKPMVALNLGIPTSPESRARTMVVAPGATLQLTKAVEHVLGGELTFLASTTYTHPLYQSVTPSRRDSAPYAFSCAGGTTCQDQVSGSFNPSDSLSYSLLVAGEWGKWSPALFYLGASQWAYQGKTPTNPVDGTPVESAQGFEPTNVRQSSYFSAWLDYNANSWLTAEVGYSLFRSVLDSDGTYGNPFFARYQDMRVYLGANFNIDNLVKQLQGGAADGGVIRAKSANPRMATF